jgi:hypothetical protein
VAGRIVREVGRRVMVAGRRVREVFRRIMGADRRVRKIGRRVMVQAGESGRCLGESWWQTGESER